MAYQKIYFNTKEGSNGELKKQSTNHILFLKNCKLAGANITLSIINLNQTLVG